MTLVGVVGDCTTTTCVALASAWPAEDGVVILEADPSGGSLAGWLDTPVSPSLATIVATVAAEAGDLGSGIHPTLAMSHLSRAGIRFIAAPVRSVPAHRAIAESGGVLAELERAPVLVLADCGRSLGADWPARALSFAAAIVVVHRQETASAAANVVRLERVVETIEQAGAGGRPLVLAIVGSSPFEPTEVAHFVDEAVPGVVTDLVELAHDALSAAVIAGRTGVSARRLSRLPLMRTAATAAQRIRALSFVDVPAEGRSS